MRWIVLRVLLALPLAMLVMAGSAIAQDLSDFRQEMQAAALQAGISQHTIDQSLRNFQPIEHVIELDRRQPESTQTFDEYADKVMTDSRIEKGRAMLAENRPLLARIKSDYGVSPAVLVALWGMESSFGSVQGDYAIIPSLATLAYEGRRHDFFKDELIKAMKIVDEGDIPFPQMTGSWAGAMGQVQFMPSTFLAYAVDYTGSGRRDIWHSDADALASAANYLSQIGWKPDEPWGREVSLPARFSPALIGPDKAQSLDTWRRLGVRTLQGDMLPDRDLTAALIMPDGPQGRAFLTYDNYKALMHWNHSNKFALTIGMMSDAMDGRE